MQSESTCVPHTSDLVLVTSLANNCIFLFLMLIDQHDLRPRQAAQTDWLPQVESLSHQVVQHNKQTTSSQREECQSVKGLVRLALMHCILCFPPWLSHAYSEVHFGLKAVVTVFRKSIQYVKSIDPYVVYWRGT
jgi:hypothetical protein